MEPVKVTHDVGKYFLKDGEVWQMIAYCKHPTATMEEVKTSERRTGAVDSPFMEEFERLKTDSEL